MSERTDKDYIEWLERMYTLRTKYKDTPPGFVNDREKDRARARILKVREKYEEKTEFRISEDYIAPGGGYFVGREKYLAEMEKQFAKGKGPVILYGIGGIGKTALARAYIRKHQKEYDGVLFLSYNTGLQALICDDCQLAVTNLHYSQDKYKNKNRYFKDKVKILTEIAEKTKLLMVIDDCNTQGDPKMEAVLSIPCDFLITTRVNPRLWGDYRGIHVKELTTQKEWTEFIRVYQNQEFTPDQQRKLMDYCSQIKGHTLLMMLKIKEGGTFEENMLTKGLTDDFFFRYALKKDEKQVMRELSVMPVQGIEESLFQKISSTSQKSVDRLVDCLLIRREKKLPEGEAWLSLHPLIAEAARKMYTPTMTNCHNLMEGFAKQAWNAWNRTYLENQRLEPYALALLQAFPQPEPWLARRLDDIVTLLWIQGYYGEAEEYSKKIFCSVEQYYGAVHQMTGEFCLRMAAVYYNSLNFSQAESWYWKGFAIMNQCQPFDKRYHLVRSIAYEKVSRIYRYKKQYEKALELIEEAIQSAGYYRDKKGKENMTPREGNWEIQYQYCCLSKAKILARLGQLDRAQEICCQGAAIVTRDADGVSNGFRSNEFNSLFVEILIKKGEYERAEAVCRALVEKALQYRQRHYKDTLSCREQLADIYQAEGKKEEATEAYEDILRDLLREYPYQTQWIDRIHRKINDNLEIE